VPKKVEQISKLTNPAIHLSNNVILSPVDYARNLGVIFDENLSFAPHISAVSNHASTIFVTY